MQKRLQALQIEQQKREFAKKYLENDAFERLMNVRISNRELYTQLIDIIISLAQSRRIQGKMNDAQLRDLLTRLTYKPEPSITFQHK